MYRIEADQFNSLLEKLKQKGFALLGPMVVDEAVMYGSIESSADMPIGFKDAQEKGRYRIKKGNDKTLFDYTLGPSSWKRFLFPPQKTLFEVEKNSFVERRKRRKKMAFIGMRACELTALSIHDKVFLESLYVDTHYKQARKDVFIVAVNCARPTKVCFCVSMETGPQVRQGYDIALTEVFNQDGHYLVMETGSKMGREMVKGLPLKAVKKREKAAAQGVVSKACKRMGRTVNTKGIQQLLSVSYDNPYWEEVGKRCLSCGNCTLVCPTCFCSTVEDYTDLGGERALRQQKWDSCFNQEFSYLHGGSVRKTTKSRYRQWLTHKFATWWEQFGSSGCVGCGRCITWCPVGIDVTEEMRRIQENVSSSKK